MPFSPFRISSGAAPTRLATTGRPAANPSMSAFECPSEREGRTKTSLARSGIGHVLHVAEEANPPGEAPGLDPGHELGVGRSLVGRLVAAHQEQAGFRPGPRHFPEGPNQDVPGLDRYGVADGRDHELVGRVAEGRAGPARGRPSGKASRDCGFGKVWTFAPETPRPTSSSRTAFETVRTFVAR